MAREMASMQTGKWLGLPVIATIARLLCRKLTLQNEYLRLENKILRSKIEGRILQFAVLLILMASASVWWLRYFSCSSCPEGSLFVIIEPSGQQKPVLG